jgi:hypothetical protein
MDGRRQLVMTTRFISTFFDVYLKGVPDSELRRFLGSHEIESMH